MGLTEITWPHFTVLNATSALLWTGLLVGSGYLFGSVIEEAVDENWGIWSVVLLGAFVLCIRAAWLRVRRLASASQVGG